LTPPICAVPSPAILKNPDLFRGKNIGVIIAGGDVYCDQLPWITAKGDKQ
jgi:threonine dehydratase